MNFDCETSWGDLPGIEPDDTRPPGAKVGGSKATPEELERLVDTIQDSDSLSNMEHQRMRGTALTQAREEQIRRTASYLENGTAGTVDTTTLQVAGGDSGSDEEYDDDDASAVWSTSTARSSGSANMNMSKAASSEHGRIGGAGATPPTGDEGSHSSIGAAASAVRSGTPAEIDDYMAFTNASLEACLPLSGYYGAVSTSHLTNGRALQNSVIQSDIC